MFNRITSFLNRDQYRLPLSKKGRRHGWKPDLPDHRDHHFTRTSPVLNPVDLRTSPYQPAIWDQGNLGSCTAHGIGRCFEFDLRKTGINDYMPSRLFIYYQERVIEGTVRQDAGAQIRDGIKVIATYGVPPETDWPYNINKFTVAPSRTAYADALKHKAVLYQRVDNSTAANIQHALSLGFPVVFGCTLYESFESDSVAANGLVPMPGANEQPIGGHCMAIVGWLANGQWIVANSWGPGWGSSGYCYFPQAYLTNLNLTNDCWIVETIKK